MNVSEFFDRYRLALRMLWNVGFWSDVDCRENRLDAVDGFRGLQVPLFRAMANGRFGDLTDKGYALGAKFSVVPKDLEIGLPSALIDYRKPSKAWEGSWAQISRKDLIGADLALVGLFDWSPFQYLDFRWYLCLVVSCPPKPEFVGQHVLVDVFEADVLVDLEAALEGDPATAR